MYILNLNILLSAHPNKHIQIENALNYSSVLSMTPNVSIEVIALSHTLTLCKCIPFSNKIIIDQFMMTSDE